MTKAGRHPSSVACGEARSQFSWVYRRRGSFARHRPSAARARGLSALGPADERHGRQSSRARLPDRVRRRRRLRHREVRASLSDASRFGRRGDRACIEHGRCNHRDRHGGPGSELVPDRARAHGLALRLAQLYIAILARTRWRPCRRESSRGRRAATSLAAPIR